MGSGESCCKIPAIHTFITFRLADSLPRQLLDDRLRTSSSLTRRRTSRDAFLAGNPPPWEAITEACYRGQFSDKLDEHLDAAHGSCALREPRLDQIVADRLHHFGGQRYDLGSYVIVPNRLHEFFALRDGASAGRRAIPARNCLRGRTEPPCSRPSF